MKNINIKFAGKALNLTDNNGWKEGKSLLRQSKRDQEKLINAMSIAALNDIDFALVGTSNNPTRLNDLYKLLLGTSGRITNNNKLLVQYVREVFAGVRFVKAEGKFITSGKGAKAAEKRTLKSGAKNCGMFKHVYAEKDNSEKPLKDPMSIKALGSMFEKVALKRDFVTNSESLTDQAKADTIREFDQALISAMVESFGGAESLINAIKKQTSADLKAVDSDTPMTEAERGAEALRDADKVADTVNSLETEKAVANA